MSSKTKEFQLSEETTFKNEIIHFFNINAMNSTIYIYLEIDGKRAKSEKTKKNFHKLILKDIEAKNEKKEIKCFIVEDIELKILIKIISKYKSFFRRKSKSFYKKVDDENQTRERKNSLPHQSAYVKPGMSIKDKIKIFTGELIKRQINNNKAIPGRLIIPKIFQNDIKKDKKDLEKKDNKNHVDKPKEDQIKTEK
jgi:hypothetical protein